jgi:hypothetical protein
LPSISPWVNPWVKPIMFFFHVVNPIINHPINDPFSGGPLQSSHWGNHQKNTRRKLYWAWFMAHSRPLKKGPFWLMSYIRYPIIGFTPLLQLEQLLILSNHGIIGWPFCIEWWVSTYSH